eukprot:TRINITY_DN4397_c0_g5_i1.p1 TRINITY_DN4397_c0_g5~~TRINITY_DN4397_c0_g5_i1.p1  ORF type:complete len:357 (-),score=30.69 TRINITY_DN4397_c0_g5_i1:291-1361(-)
MIFWILVAGGVTIWALSPYIWNYIPYGKQIYEQLAAQLYWSQQLKEFVKNQDSIGLSKLTNWLSKYPGIVSYVDQSDPLIPYAARFQDADHGDTSIVQILLDIGCQINAQVNDDKSAWTALHYSVARKNERLVKFLLEKGALVDIKDRGTPQGEEFNEIKLREGGRTAFMIAAAVSTQEIAKLILANADVSLTERDDEGRTCLHHACASNRPQMIDFLIDNGCDISVTSSDGSQMMHFAAGYGGYDMVYFLLSLKFPINDQDNQGRSPLMRAVMANDLESAKLLVNKGAEVNQITKDGKASPLSLAQSFEMVAMLESFGADIFQEIEAEEGQTKTVVDILKQRLSSEELARLDSYD